MLASVPRPEVKGVRWTTEAQWHVTLAFLGDIAEPQIDAVGTALTSLAALAAASPEARLGPATRRYGRSVLGVPVAGLDDLAAAVRRGCLPGGDRREGRFDGHLTLARGRGGRPVPASLEGRPLEAVWRVREVCLVASDLDPGGARYTTLVRATVPS